jgi:hypothetical protein
MTDIASPIPGAYADVDFIAYAVRESAKIVYQLFVARTGLNGDGVLGYVLYDLAAAEPTAEWFDLLPSMPNYSLVDDEIYAFWRLPGDLLDEDKLILLHSESNSIPDRVVVTIVDAATGAIEDSIELTSEGDGTSFFSQHPQIMALPPTEGPAQWYVASVSEDADKLSVFELNFDTAVWTVIEHMYNSALGITLGVGETLSKQFTFGTPGGFDTTLFIPTRIDSGVHDLRAYPVLLLRPWVAPVVGDEIIVVPDAPDTAQIEDALLVEVANNPRLLFAGKTAAVPSRVIALDQDPDTEVWTEVYSVTHLVDDFNESQFQSYTALDEIAGLASSPHLRGDRTVLMTEDAEYTLFCFIPGEFHDISPLGEPIHASSITYDFFVRHALDASNVPQLSYFLNAGLDEYCRPIATVRYV